MKGHVEMNVDELILNHGPLFPKIDDPDYRSWKRGRHVFLFNRNIESESEILIRVTPEWAKEESFELLVFSTRMLDGVRETRVFRLVEPGQESSLEDRLYVLWGLVYRAKRFELKYSGYELVEAWGPFYSLPSNCVGSVRIPECQDRWDEYRVPVGYTAGQGLRYLAGMTGFPVEETELELNMAEDVWEPDDYRVFPNHVVTNPENGRSVTTLWGSDNPMSNHQFVGYERDGRKTYIDSEYSRPILASIHSWLLGC